MFSENEFHAAALIGDMCRIGDGFEFFRTMQSEAVIVPAPDRR
jgi:hypothetical protein